MPFRVLRGSRLMSAVVSAVLIAGGCLPCPQGPADAPEIVPGRSMAGIELGTTYEQMVASVGAEPLADGLTFFYASGVSGSVTDANGDGRANGQDLVAQLTAEMPYRGTTAGGAGVGGALTCMREEFGDPDSSRGALQYDSLGIAFTASMVASDQVPLWQIVLAAMTRQPVSIRQVSIFPQSEGFTLDLAISGSGSLDWSPRLQRYQDGQPVSLTATAEDGWRFDRWDGAVEGGDNPVTLTITENSEVTATFIPTTLTIATTVGPQDAGTIALDPKGPEFALNEEVTVTASPATGYLFDRWEGSLEGDANPAMLTVAGNEALLAVFTPTQHTVTSSVSPENAGTVAFSAEVDTYPFGAELGVLATAAAGFQFDHWQGDLEGTDNLATLEIDGDKSIAAVFVTAALSITTEVTPTDAGSVAVEPEGPTFEHGAGATITATAAEGFAFDYWVGAEIGQEGENPLTVTMVADLQLQAVFVSATYTVTGTVSPTGSGTIEADPLAAVYDAGSEVTLIARAADGYEFSRWDLGGGDDRVDNPLLLTITADIVIEAVFLFRGFSLETAVQPEGAGAVSVEPDNVLYADGALVALTPVPAEGYVFDGWTGDLAGRSTPGELVMNSSKSVTAVFRCPDLLLTATASPADGGTVARDPDQECYPAGTEVTLTPSPAEGYAFNRWEGGLTGIDSPATVVVNSDTSVTAVFVFEGFGLAVAVSPEGAGTVARSPDRTVYAQGETVTLTPGPADGFVFVRWEGDATGTDNPLRVTMDGDKSLTAVFEAVGAGSVGFLVTEPTDCYPWASGWREVSVRLAAWSSRIGPQMGGGRLWP